MVVAARIDVDRDGDRGPGSTTASGERATSMRTGGDPSVALGQAVAAADPIAVRAGADGPA